MPAESSAAEVGARLAAVRSDIAAAASRVGRDPAAVQIVAVTKTFVASTVAAAMAAGLSDVGENYVQEASAKRAAVGPGARWHLIGGLQRNKVRAALATFDCIHTVDSVALANALATGLGDRRLPVLIQVNVAGEASKRGVLPEAAEALAAAVLSLPGLRLDGLMTVPPAGGEATSRGHFRHLRELRDRVAKRLGVELPHLSMGMSDDFPVAVEEGATWLRLGRVLFGTRT